MVKGLASVVIMNPRKPKDGIIAMLEFGTPELRDIALQKLRKCVINDTVVTVKPSKTTKYNERVKFLRFWEEC